MMRRIPTAALLLAAVAAAGLAVALPLLAAFPGPPGGVPDKGEPAR